MAVHSHALMQLPTCASAGLQAVSSPSVGKGQRAAATRGATKAAIAAAKAEAAAKAAAATAAKKAAALAAASAAATAAETATGAPAPLDRPRPLPSASKRAEDAELARLMASLGLDEGGGVRDVPAVTEVWISGASKESLVDWLQV